uniref:ATP-dependent DNA helicase n=1 Tax=Solanum lycopersicum TaxID=4081 RepID=A0A3Q7EUY3_SOLLC
MADKSNRNHLNSEKAHADKKSRRRELYKLKESNKKDAYLAGRRANSAIDNNAFIGASCSTTTMSTHEETLNRDGPGGTGKSFLYRDLLATVRYRGFIALETTSSGVAASLLPGDRTAYSRFKIPINVEGKFSCNISKQSSLASLIRDAKIIVWDEI